MEAGEDEESGDRPVEASTTETSRPVELGLVAGDSVLRGLCCRDSPGPGLAERAGPMGSEAVLFRLRRLFGCALCS